MLDAFSSTCEGIRPGVGTTVVVQMWQGRPRNGWGSLRAELLCAGFVLALGTRRMERATAFDLRNPAATQPTGGCHRD